jgi:hypothetical protein
VRAASAASGRIVAAEWGTLNADGETFVIIRPTEDCQMTLPADELRAQLDGLHGRISTLLVRL